jgi:hypothetical protein
MDTNIAVLLLLALDFGAMQHCAPSETYYSRAFASIRCSGIPSVPSQPLSGFELSVLLSLNFAHLREDSAGGARLYHFVFAGPPIRPHDRLLWLRLCRAVAFCSKILCALLFFLYTKQQKTKNFS